MNTARAALVARTLLSLLGEEVRGGFRTPAADAGNGAWSQRQRQRALAVRQALERLGPLYIKIGQMLSTRPDLVPEYMTAELANLHDRVSPSPFSEFERVLVEELGSGWSSHLDDLDPRPVGTASLAQAYRAFLPSGSPAIVKIQRPGIRQVVLDDMALLEKVVSRIARRAPDFNDVMDLGAMLELLFASMRPELDFTLEAENMEGFRDRVADFDTLAVPQVHLVTPRVLVMGVAEGASIRDVDPTRFTHKQREQIGRDLLAFMFWSYFVDRKFHADPHPGNIFVSPDGVASIIDWGQVAQVDRNLSTAMVAVLLSICMNDATMMARTWIEMGRATRRADIAGFVSDMGRFVPGLAGQALSRLNFGLQLTSVLKYSSRRGIATSPHVATLGKSFANLEGSIRYLVPEISITDVFEEEFISIGQALAGELLSQEFEARTAVQMLLLLLHGPAQIRGVMTDMANRDLTLRLGEDMNIRSRHEDRADARLKRAQRAAVAAALAGLWLQRRWWRTGAR